MTEYDVKALERVFPTLTMPYAQFEMMRGIASRARALLAQRDALKAERDEAIRKQMKANEELTECLHALGGFMGPTAGIAEEVKKVVAELTASNDTICRLSRDRDTERAERQKAYARLQEVYRERDVEHGRAQDLELRLADRARGDAHVNAERDRDKEARDEAYRLLGHERTEHRAVVAERDTLAARVKELEGAKNEFGFNPRMMEMVTVMTSMAEELEKTSAELAAVKSDRDGIIAQAKETYTNFGFLCDIRDVLKTTKFGYNLVAAIKAMKDELEQAKKEAAFGRASLEHAKALGIDTNKELGQQYRALRRDAEAWRRMFPHGLWINADEASKIVVRYHFRDKDTKEVVVKDNGAPEYSSTAVNPAKPGLQPMNCVCGGQITFRDARVGTCQKCGASCRVIDPPPATVPTDTSPLPWCGYEADIAGYGKAWITRSSGGMYMWHAMVCGVSMEDDIMFGDSDRAKKVADKHVARYLAGKDSK